MSVIAVSVSLIGLSAVVFTLAILVELIVSFPQMLSSNSQAYVHQQRKLYNISGAPDPRTETTTEGLRQEQEDKSGDRWIDVDEQTSGGISTTPRSTALRARRKESMSRGRTLKRQTRRHTARTALRV